MEFRCKVSVAIIAVVSFMMAFTSISLGDLMVLFDEDDKDEAGAGDFVGKFSNHDAGSTVTITDDDSFSGKVSAYTTPDQSFNNQMGWLFRIVEDPKGKDEYRYIRFAWKADGGTGVMIQFPDNGAWGVVTDACVDPPAEGTNRYIAGVNVTGWSGVCVDDDIPKKWTVVERDMFEDFGTFTITGVALTPFGDGGAGDYYDAIMLAADEREFPSGFAVSSRGKLITFWSEVKNSY